MRALTGWAVAAAVGLTACGGSSAEEPRSLPTLASVAASPSAVAVVPSEAAGETPQAAAEFAKFFYAQVEEGFRTKNPGLVSRISLPSCTTCKLYIDSITGLRDRNERLEGGHFDVKLAVSPGASGGKTPVDVQVAYAGSTRYKADGSIIRKNAPVVIDEELALVRSSGRWRVFEVTRVRTR